jgi:hypothetical protein
VADQRHELALGHREVDVAQRDKRALGRLEGLLDALDFDVLAGQADSLMISPLQM